MTTSTLSKIRKYLVFGSRTEYKLYNTYDNSVEEHRSLGGSIISRLDNGAFVGLIYELLVFS